MELEEIYKEIEKLEYNDVVGVLGFAEVRLEILENKPICKQCKKPMDKTMSDICINCFLENDKPNMVIQQKRDKDE